MAYGNGRRLRRVGCLPRSDVPVIYLNVDAELPAVLKIPLECVVKKNFVALLHVRRLVGDLKADLGNVLLGNVRLEYVRQVLDRALEVALVVLEQLGHVVALQARVSDESSGNTH